ncbi:HNH endonuclease [Gordonia sputi]
MALSKRLRYEILRRDNHTCRYCGASAPDVTLTVDHVVPVALGGLDDPSNLVAACRDCNAGKSASAPDAPLVANIAETAGLWKAALAAAVAERARETPESPHLVGADLVEHFEVIWTKYWSVGTNDGGRNDRIYFPRPNNWRDTIIALVDAGITLNDLAEFVRVAIYSGADDTWRYFCKCAWNQVGRYQSRAAEILAVVNQRG